MSPARKTFPDDSFVSQIGKCAAHAALRCARQFLKDRLVFDLRCGASLSDLPLLLILFQLQVSECLSWVIDPYLSFKAHMRQVRDLPRTGGQRPSAPKRQSSIANPHPCYNPLSWPLIRLSMSQ